MPDKVPDKVTDQTPIQTTIQVMRADDTLRVWSFIVTLFGDLARGRHDALSGAILNQITSRVGIKPASMRVALHRLRKDGWIDTRREGRAGWYFLTEYGRSETLDFSQRVYAPAGIALNRADQAWQIIVFAPNHNKASDTASLFPLPGQQGVFLGLGQPLDLPNALSVTGQIGPIPNWLQLALAGPELHQDYRTFETKLAEVSAHLPPKINALDRAVLRGLVVHSWRRLLLRHPDLPDGFFGSECRIGPCRISVTSLLAHLGPVTPDDLAHIA